VRVSVEGCIRVQHAMSVVGRGHAVAEKASVMDRRSPDLVRKRLLQAEDSLDAVKRSNHSLGEAI
jgi:hypothetical protein